MKHPNPTNRRIPNHEVPRGDGRNFDRSKTLSYLDCHSHTAEWSDGRQSIEQVLEKARAEGVRVGLSDHAGIADYLNSNDRLLAYADFLTQYPVARGLEMDLGRSFLIDSQTRKRFDYLIGSVHNLSGDGFAVEFHPFIRFLNGELPHYDVRAQIKDMDLFFKTHLELLKKEFSKQKFDILGHCSLLPPLALGAPEEHFPQWWEEELIKILLTYGVAMEISNRWRTPYGRLMEKAVEGGVRFSCGSDGHSPKKTCVLDYPKEMIERFRVPSDRIFDVARKIEAA